MYFVVVVFNIIRMKLIKQDVALGIIVLAFILAFWRYHTYNKNIDDNKKVSICKVVGYSKEKTRCYLDYVFKYDGVLYRSTERIDCLKKIYYEKYKYFKIEFSWKDPDYNSILLNEPVRDKITLDTISL